MESFTLINFLGPNLISYPHTSSTFQLKDGTYRIEARNAKETFKTFYTSDVTLMKSFTHVSLNKLMTDDTVLIVSPQFFSIAIFIDRILLVSCITFVQFLSVQTLKSSVQYSCLVVPLGFSKQHVHLKFQKT